MSPYESKLKEIADRNEALIVMTAENRIHIRHLPDILGERFIDVGIAEQTMAGMASGLALRGKIPVLHALAPFLTMRAFEFVRTDAGIANLPVKLSGFIPGFLSEANGPTHQAIEDIGIMRSIPNMGVFCPSCQDELLEHLEEVILAPQPYYIRYNERPAPTGFLNCERVGKTKIPRRGEGLLVLTTGILLSEILGAAITLESSSLKPTIAHLPFLHQLDEDPLTELLASHDQIVTVEDHLATGGLFTAIAEFSARRGLNCKIEPIALTTWYRAGQFNDVLDYEGFSPDKLASRLLDIHSS